MEDVGFWSLEAGVEVLVYLWTLLEGRHKLIYCYSPDERQMKVTR